MKRFDLSAFGEILIDFTEVGKNKNGIALFAQNPGGAPANVLAAATRLGSRTAFLGKVGEDLHGRYLKSVLEAENINTDGLVFDADTFTTLAFVSLNEEGERTFSFARKPGADTMMRPEELDSSVLENTRIFHVGSLSLTDDPSRQTTFAALEMARHAGAIISYDPNYRAPLWRDEATAMEHMRSVIPFADLMKISDEETVLLTGKTSPEEAAAELVRQGVSAVAVTLGSAGAVVASRHGVSTVPGFPVSCIDTTGAGDSFWAGFLHSLLTTGKEVDQFEQGDLEDAALMGNAVASLCVQAQGAIPAMPSLEEVKAVLRERTELIESIH